jgi:hypothetical protein
MRKIYLTLFALLICTSVYAGTRWAPRQYFGADQVITTSPATIIDGSIYWSGLTAGDRVALRNGTTVTSAAVLTLVVPTAAGTMPIAAEGFTVDNGLYMDVTVTAGTLGLNLLYQ